MHTAAFDLRSLLATIQEQQLSDAGVVLLVCVQALPAALAVRVCRLCGLSALERVPLCSQPCMGKFTISLMVHVFLHSGVCLKRLGMA